MNELPPIAPSAAAPRKRRVQRSGAAARGGRRKRKRSPILTWWEGALLGLMALGLILILTSLSRADESLLSLRAQRENEKIAWEKEVASHQVRYRDLIEYYAAANRLDPAYVAAIIKRESDYDPRAESSKGALGLMQFMPATFDWVKNNCGYRNADISVLYEPEAAIRMGCYLLRYIIGQLNSDDPVLVACAYHAGWGNVKTWLENYSADGKTLALSEIPMPDTRHYAGKVLNAYAIYQQYYY